MAQPLIPGIEVVPATPAHIDGVAEIVNPACMCQYWRMTSGEYSRSTAEQRLAALKAQLGERPPGGLVAYLDGLPVGWVGFAPRERVGRLGRSRTIPRVDDLPVWSIFCFTVRVGYRRQGVAQALLTAVIAHARDAGGPMLEAYPVETGGKRIHGTAAYHGTAAMFERAGFRRVAETQARADHLPRVVMRLDPSQAPATAAGPSRGTRG